jgi:hypothetical protein
VTLNCLADGLADVITAKLRYIRAETQACQLPKLKSSVLFYTSRDSDTSGVSIKTVMPVGGILIDAEHLELSYNHRIIMTQSKWLDRCQSGPKTHNLANCELSYPRNQMIQASQGPFTDPVI